MKILHIDDHQLFCEGMALLLRHIEPSAHVVHANSVPAGLALLQSSPAPELIFTDLQLPGVQGLEALAQVRRATELIPVVVLAANEDPAVVRAAIDMGAMGYIPKSSSSSEVSRALSMVVRGGVYLPLGAQAAPLPARLNGHVLRGLTPRQMQVLRSLVQGKSNKVIARDLDIADSTVKSHVAVIFEVLNVHSRSQAMYVLAQLGLP